MTDEKAETYIWDDDGDESRETFDEIEAFEARMRGEVPLKKKNASHGTQPAKVQTTLEMPIGQLAN